MAFAALFVVSTGLTGAAGAVTSIPSSYWVVNDQQGANDVNAEQVDLTRFGRDDSDPAMYKLFWSWDTTDFTAQTGNACALFDSNGDGNIDFAVCGEVENQAEPPAIVETADSPYAFTCGDDKNDRCTNPTPVNTAGILSGALTDAEPGASPPANLITATDPFENLIPDQHWPNDSTLAVFIPKSILPNLTAVLVNVCSYPSAGAGGNNNPFDCIVTPGGGFLEIEKVAPDGTTQQFSFTVDGAGSPTTITGSGTSDPIPLLIGSNHSVTEAVPADWRLDSASCALKGGGSTGTKSDNTVSGITIESGKVTTCTFTDSLRTGTLTVIKHVVNDNGGTKTAGDFSLHVMSGSTDVSGSPAAGSETGTSYTLPVGSYAVSESTPPDGYTRTEISGDCSASGNVAVVAGETKTCTITNNDVAPKLHLLKVVTNDNGGTKTVADFTLTANGTGSNDLSGTSPVDSGAGLKADTWALSETNVAGYTASSWVCVGGTQDGSNITLGVGEEATCTVTNDDMAAHLKLVKKVTNDSGGTAVATDFTLSAAGPTPISGAGGVESDVNPGTYSLSETNVAGYTASSWVCAGGTQEGASVSLTLGETSTCTITNDDRAAHLTLTKVVSNTHGGTAKAIDWTLTAGPNGVSGAGGASADINAGTYTLSESAGPSGYTAGSWSCTGGNFTAPDTISLANGESASCQITNSDQAAHLIVIKHVVNDDGGTAVASDFTLDSGGANDTPDNFAGAESPGTHVTLDAGSYSVTETGTSGYAASFSADCSGKIANGQTKTCTITNDDIAPKLHLRKVVVNNDGGSKTVADFPLSADGTGSNDLSGVSPVNSGATLKADTWTLSETTQAGYAPSDWVCVGGSQSTNHITLGVGEEATCTITNDDIASPPPPPPSHPGISIVKSPHDQSILSGSTANWTITITNTGDVTLTGVTVTDALAPGCARTSATLTGLASMAPNASVTYTCTLANVIASFTNVAVVTGTPPTGADVTASDSAPVAVTTLARVEQPAITIVKAPSLQTITEGGTATFQVTVTNTGDVTLHNVTVTDPKSPDCSRDLGTMAAGVTRSYTCTRPGVTTGFTNVMNVVGISPAGKKVTGSDNAVVKTVPFLPPANPAIRIVKNPKTQTVAVGGTAKFSITVANIGNVTLHAVKVTDPKSPACNRGLGSLKAGTSKAYSCSQPNVKAPYTNVAAAVGTSPAGHKVKDQDSARVSNVKAKPAFTG